MNNELEDVEPSFKPLPMERAPKDGSRVLLKYGDTWVTGEYVWSTDRLTGGHFNHRWEADTEDWEFSGPDGWLPLPEKLPEYVALLAESRRPRIPTWSEQLLLQHADATLCLDKFLKNTKGTQIPEASSDTVTFKRAVPYTAIPSLEKFPLPSWEDTDG